MGGPRFRGAAFSSSLTELNASNKNSWHPLAARLHVPMAVVASHPMRPPICAICRERFDPEEGGLVSFALGGSDDAWQKRMEARGAKGHPPWREWFCGLHVAAARERTHLSRADALHEMRVL